MTLRPEVTSHFPGLGPEPDRRPPACEPGRRTRPVVIVGTTIRGVPEPSDARAIIVDPWPMIRVGLATVLAGVGVRTVAEADDDVGLTAVLSSQPVDVVVLGDADVATVEAVRRAAPAGQVPAVVALLSRAAPDDLRALLAVGIDAALARSVDADELGTTVLRVLRGERVISPSLLPLLFSGTPEGTDPTVGDLSVGAACQAEAGVAATGAKRRAGGPLTAKEREVVRLLAVGRSTGEIAAALFVSQATVKTHLAHIYAKLAVRGRHEALARAAALGLLS